MTALGFPAGYSPPITAADTQILPPENESCYEKIVKSIMTYTVNLFRTVPTKRSTPIEQTVSVYFILFRQSQSWEPVQKLCAQIINSTDKKETHLTIEEKECIKTYANQWKARILKLAERKKRIKKLNAALIEATSKDQKTARVQSIQNLKRLNTIGLKQGEIQLTNASTDANLQSIIKRSKRFRTLVQFLKDFWDNLTLFSKWEGISMNKERLYVQMHYPAGIPTKPFDCEESFKQDKSLRAIFLVKSAFVYGGSLQCRMANYSFAERRDSLERSSLSLQRAIDAYEPSCSSNQASSSQESSIDQATPSLLQENIKDIVTLAIHQINYHLNRSLLEKKKSQAEERIRTT